MSFIKDLAAIRNILIVVISPIVLLPIPLAVEGKESACGYVMILMAVYWITEAIPIYVTGLLPVFLFPVVGVMSAGEVGSVFLNGATLMFTGGMVVAVAIEEWGIHKRIALRMLLLLGSKPAWLMLGLMLTAWFLSMWISNTATTAMMLPIVNAVLDHLSEENNNQDGEDEPCLELTIVQKGDTIVDADQAKVDTKIVDHDNEDNSAVNGGIDHATIVNGNIRHSGDHSEAVKGDSYATSIPEDSTDSRNARSRSDDIGSKRIRTAFNLCVAYAASIGGAASMTGSTPNIVLKGQADLVYGKLGKESPLTFGTWLLYGIPTTFVIVVLAWVWLMVFFLRCRAFSSCCGRDNSKEASRIRRVLLEEYSALGKLSFAQMAVIGHLVLLVALWVTRDLGGVYGWSKLFQDKFINDAVPAILVGVLVFTFPSSIPRLFCCKSRGAPGEDVSIRPLLTWDRFHTKMPWGIVLLLGGGFSLAKAAQVSGLSAVIGNQLSGLSSLDPWLLTLVVCIIVAAATEVTSNTATTALLLPILSNLALTIGLEPLYLMMPATFAASFAFMLPVATPPNAVVFSSGHVTVISMVKVGVVLNLIAVLVLQAMNETLGKAIF